MVASCTPLESLPASPLMEIGPPISTMALPVVLTWMLALLDWAYAFTHRACLN